MQQDHVLRTITLDKDVPIPLYYQLKKQILELIKGSVLQSGDMLPPENELCDLLQVSRPTIRQAFGELVAEGYLHRYKGKGTFVAKPKVADRFLSKVETFNQEMISKGLTPSTRVLKLEIVSNNSDAAEKLELPINASLIYLSRVRSADDVPLVYLETYLPYERFPDLFDVDFTTHSLYESFEKLYGVRVNRVFREIESVNARKEEALLLQIAQNKALSLVKTIAYTQELQVPVEYSIARYRGDRNKFSVEIYR